MSASEMERLRERLEDWKSMHAEEVGHHNQTLKRLDAITKDRDYFEAAYSRKLADEKRALEAAQAANTAKSQALEALRGARAMVASFQRAPWAHDLLAYLDAALSGSSAPQATNPEELLKALRAANARLLENGHAILISGGSCCDACDRAALSMESEESAPACTCGSADDVHKITCATLAYLHRPPTGPFPPPPKSEGSDPDSSQKGEP